ncbi:MAG: hypothetical protein H0X66_07440 [Verrucomicrobia bacterium]|nr:hypothetical protein [Verrucomicrobiota bacterium]
MRLKIDDIWSPDLDKPSSGQPDDVRDFSVFMQVSVSQRFHRGYEVFQFFACSTGKSQSEHQPALEFREFDWSAIRQKIGALLDECGTCKTWDDVIAKLAPSLDYSDK